MSAAWTYLLRCVQHVSPKSWRANCERLQGVTSGVPPSRQRSRKQGLPEKVEEIWAIAT